ncbi:MAG: hypothetical protein GYB65_09000 [Chloroflexi bacterium]|nr:hypothetical protein [Chloroflexota bacterium]
MYSPTHFRALSRVRALTRGQQMWRAVLAFALCAGLLLPALHLAPVHAQSGPNRQLAVGDIVTAPLNADTFSQTYTLSASTGDTITLEVSTETADLNPVLTVIDQRGNRIAQDADLNTPTAATLTDISIPSSGTFFITVARGSGAEGSASGQFTLRVSGFQQIGGQTVTLDQGGIAFELAWTAAVDLNLEVRDPVGGTVHTYSPGSPSGGTLDADANTNCENLADEPSEVISWPAGQVPAGSYEVIIYYIDGCEVNGPQVFDLTTTVNDATPQSISGTLNPGQSYISRLVVNPDGGWTLNNGGVNAGLFTVSLFQNQINSAEPMALGSTVTGVLSNASPARAYSFQGTSGTAINIALEAESGSLDTFVALLGPDNTVLATNDDSGDSTNSGIERTLVADGTYTIIATRYGLNIGGTEGEYLLTLRSLEVAADLSAGDQGATETTEATGFEDTGFGDTGFGPEVTEQLTLTQGSIEVKLTWDTNADLQLQVRDPGGETVFDDNPISQSGGVLEADGNVACLETTETPTSYIYWPPNRLPNGVYEVEIWFQSACDDIRNVNFDLEVNVQGQTIIRPASQSISPGARYMITFRIGADGTTTVGTGGFFDMDNPNTLLDFDVLLAPESAIPIAYNDAVSGSITTEQPYVIYSFEGQQGDIISIAMQAQGGTLDPALYLVSSEGILLEGNDDIDTQGENRDSAIQEYPLGFTDTYYIIATHYGLIYGGTEGTYALTLIQE